MAIEPGWKVTHKSAANLARWDAVCMNELRNVKDKLPALNTENNLTIIDVGANTGTLSELMNKSFESIGCSISLKLLIIFSKDSSELRCQLS